MEMMPPPTDVTPSPSTNRPVRGFAAVLVQRQHGAGAQHHLGDLVALDLVGRAAATASPVSIDSLDRLDRDLASRGLQLAAV